MRAASLADRTRSHEGESRVPELILSCSWAVNWRMLLKSTGSMNSGLVYRHGEWLEAATKQISLTFGEKVIGA